MACEFWGKLKKVFTYLYDGHGTVRALANENGKITDTYCYDAFGNLLNSTGTTANSYRYCGEQFDSTTGLYYLRARYMDTSTGRFISMDTYQGTTADPISLHKYLYANSNPVMYTDPSGYMVATLKKPSASAIVLWAQLESMAKSYAMAMWNLFLTYLPTVMVAATGFAKIIMDSPAYMDILQQFASGNLSIYDLNQMIIEDCQKAVEQVKDYLANNNRSSGNSNGSSPNNHDPNKWKDFWVKAGKNFKDHYIRHKDLLTRITGEKYPKWSESNNGEAFLKDVEKAIQNGTVKFEGTGTLNKTSEVMNIFRGNGVTIVTKLNGEFVTILESGEGMDLAIRMIS